MLLTRGCLWNSFVIVANIAALLALFKSAVPPLFDYFVPVRFRLTTPREAEVLRALYARLESTDFSREVLARSPANLAVLRVDDIGWSDLGEPRRVMAALARIEAQCSVTGVQEGA